MSALHDFLNHPIETLERALHIRKQIDQLNEVLKDLFGPSPVSLAGVQTSALKRRGRPPKAKKRITTVESGDVPVAEPAPTAKAKTKGGISAAGRARIAAAQKKRWAKVKGETGATAKTALVAKKKKRKLGPEARARIVAAVKARWAKVKIEKR